MFEVARGGLLVAAGLVDAPKHTLHHCLHHLTWSTPTAVLCTATRSPCCSHVSMPQGQRPQRKAAAVAREKLAQGGNKASTDKAQRQTGQKQQPSSPKAVAAGRKTAPKVEVEPPAGEVKPQERMPAEREADAAPADKKEDEASTAPLPEKVRHLICVLTSVQRGCDPCGCLC